MTLFNVIFSQQLHVTLLAEEKRVTTLRKENQEAFREYLDYQREALEEKHRARRLLLVQVQDLASSLLNLVLVFLLGLSVGVMGGVNLPNAVLCEQGNGLCHFLRVRSPKVVR